MGFKTPFDPQIHPGYLYEFSWSRIQRQTKTALVNMIGSFFDAHAQIYGIQMPDIVGIRNYDDIKKIFITPDFPYQQRKLPLIVVSIKGGKERKMYIGADNLLYYDVRETSTGKTAVEVYAGAAEFNMVIIGIGQSPEERMRIMEALHMCFTHYFRWQYFYTYGDGNTFSIVPSIEQLIIGSEQEAEGEGKTVMLYVNDITMKSFVEYTFRGLDQLIPFKSYTIDPDSGPIIYENSQ